MKTKNLIVINLNPDLAMPVAISTTGKGFDRAISSGVVPPRAVSILEMAVDIPCGIRPTIIAGNSSSDSLYSLDSKQDVFVMHWNTTNAVYGSATITTVLPPPPKKIDSTRLAFIINPAYFPAPSSGYPGSFRTNGWYPFPNLGPHRQYRPVDPGEGYFGLAYHHHGGPARIMCLTPGGKIPVNTDPGTPFYKYYVTPYYADGFESPQSCYKLGPTGTFQ
ncbi:MAG: hypothetical protein AAF614_21255 [Chloroflexota bacterium]